MNSLSSIPIPSLKQIGLATLYIGSALAWPEPHGAPSRNVPRDDFPMFNPLPSTDLNTRLIRCEYPSMKGWVYSYKKNGDWLRYAGSNPGDITEYNIDTDNDKYVPQGITRKYHLEVTDESVNMDGMVFDKAKVFNKQYPGPWIQACWGDDLEITVTNKLKHNGTAVHWHGIRMMENMFNDGVPGVTQCPIPPGSSMTYRFKASQYGSTWYHSHYSLQYADGLFGPMTIHGPSSASYDKAVDPLLMTDHLHDSAFEDFHKELEGKPPAMDSIILNGKGDYDQTGDLEKKYRTVLKPGKKYLLRLINTSVATTFVFSIDGHKFQVVGSDFVPIEPYEADHIAVGIGQRYHIILEGLSKEEAKKNGRYWMRTTPTKGCSKFAEGRGTDDRTGVIYYDRDDGISPNTERGAFSLDCRDEPLENLVPKVKWTVPDPGLDVAGAFEKSADVQLGKWRRPGYPETNSLVSNWEFGPVPMWINYSEPIIKNLDKEEFPSTWVVYPAEDHLINKWVYLVITGKKLDPISTQVAVAHPIHLHGHDFVLLQQSTEPWDPTNVNLKLNNPPRRDVTLLPAGGFIVIAFKPDNPGSWLLHCHIAWHVSAGLALQVLERKEDLKALTLNNPDFEFMKENCQRWDAWHSDKSNYWDPNAHFQDDSGV
ncbi:laccase [Nannizzia gypsea CBS 118893]|uniref:Laccase n=1 Tax=Arthroderma gypseum (strain ATCC MYA-4604 / CBS 118893) TaxID=535722 RepID=E4V687_ARTGP|nr:laccase [Nannizzia gypsea CBS 118893]EFR05270.1 laccase [Nannizzia gypsea CBS 118893]